jgi:hypothetical protein
MLVWLTSTYYIMLVMLTNAAVALDLPGTPIAADLRRPSRIRQRRSLSAGWPGRGDHNGSNPSFPLPLVAPAVAGPGAGTRAPVTRAPPFGHTGR